MISDCIYYDIPTQMKILNMVIPILMYFLTFTHQNINFVSNANHYIDQSLGMLLMTSNCRIYCRKFLMLSNQMRVIFVSALECKVHIHST